MPPPVSAQEMISRLMSQLGSEHPEIDEVFGALAARRDAASQAEASTKQQLQTAQAAPTPTTNPTADLLTRAIGSVAGTFTGSDQPQKNARDLIEAEQKKLLLKHTQDLAQLSDAYDKAYDRATKLGILEDQLKYAEKRTKITEDRKLANDILDAQVKLETAQTDKETARLKISAEMSATEDDVQSLKDAAVSGQIEFPTIPSKFKGKVLKLAADAGEIILPRKARQTIASMNGARQVMRQLEELNETIVRGKGSVGRIREGIINEAAAILQSKGRGDKATIYRDFKEGVLAVFSRAVGDVGTLNEGDINRARRLTPTLRDSDAVAAQKLVQLVEFIDDLEQRTIETYAYKLPQQIRGSKSDNSLDAILDRKGL